jgi:hypothetical protein
MPSGGEPVEQVRFILAEIDAADADLLKAAFDTPELDVCREAGIVDLRGIACAHGLSGEGGVRSV